MFEMLMAGVYIRVHNRYPFIENQCKDWIVSQSKKEPDMIVSATEEEMIQERTSESFSKGYCESICIYRNIAKQLYRFDAFVFHASVVSLDEKGYAFTAKSGVGKSTHTRYWLETFGNRAYVVNGDKPIIRYQNGTFYAYGTPWQGKENWGVNTVVPLNACSFLVRGIENKIERMNEKEVLLRLFHQVLMPQGEKAMNGFLELMEQFLQEVPFYRLECKKDRSAAMVAYQEMKQGKEGNKL